MAPPVGRVYGVCTDLLLAVETYHGGTLPDRRYVSASAPPWDCELLATWCETTAGSPGDPSVRSAEANSAGAAWAMRAGTFVVTLVRCVPIADLNGDEVVLPTTEDEQAAAQDLYEDAQRLLNALVSAYRAGELGTCHGLAFLDWRAIGPAGGLVAGELRVAVSLTGE